MPSFVQVHLGRSFEEAVEFTVTLIGKYSRAEVRKMVAEIVPDHNPDVQGTRMPSRGLPVKKVEMRHGDGRKLVQNLTPGSSFLLAVAVNLKAGTVLRSDWVTARTAPAAQVTAFDSQDLQGIRRSTCSSCSCKTFRLYRADALPQRCSNDVLCRACGCPVASHKKCDMEPAAEPQTNPIKKADATRSALRLKDEAGEFDLSLPPDATFWSQRELQLFVDSRGRFNPRVWGQKRRKLPEPDSAGRLSSNGRVSVVVPTMESRHIFHEQLWSVFDLQTWADKELIVVDTYLKSPSSFFEEMARTDDRIIYASFKIEPGSDFSIGLKRNICTHLSTGMYIANFDDDDLYSHTYLETMVTNLKNSQSDAITLSSWYVYECETGRFGHVDPEASYGKLNPEKADQYTFGYGFSYVFTRAVALQIPYLNCDLGEDYEFYKEIRFRNLRRAKGLDDGDDDANHVREGTKTQKAWLEETDEDCGVTLYRNRATGEIRYDAPDEYEPEKKSSSKKEIDDLSLQFLDPSGVELYYDRYGICLHTLHAKSTSDSYAQRQVPEEEVQDLDFADLNNIFANYLNRFPRTKSSSTYIRRVRKQYRTLMIRTSAGDVSVEVAAGATVGDVKKLITAQTGALPEMLHLYRNPPTAGHGKPDESECEDLDRVGPRTSELWAVLPIDRGEESSSPIAVNISGNTIYC